MKNRPKPWVIDLLWAGIFSAFFVFNGLQTSQDAPPVWADFPEIEAPSKWEYGSSKRADYHYPNFAQRAPKSKNASVRPTVASDTVSDLWLRAQGWPDWKAEGFVRDRQRWGGVDSLLLQRYDQRDEFHWLLSPPTRFGARLRCGHFTASGARLGRCAALRNFLTWLHLIRSSSKGFRCTSISANSHTFAAL